MASSLLRLGHQQGRRLVRPNHARRVRIEGHHDRRGAAFAGHTMEAVQNLPVPTVHAVEVAEGEHRMHPARGTLVVRKVDYIHEVEPRHAISKTWPS
jgi:hypothetical protein